LLQQIISKGELMKQEQTIKKSGNTKIIVERVYVGDKKIDEVFQTINEEVTRKNIEEKIRLKIGA
jgi:hypothetical protein